MSTTSEPTPAIPEPTESSGLSTLLVGVYAITNLLVWTVVLTPAAVTLALKVRALDPDGASISLSVVSLLGAAVAVVANPLFGRLSDRTRSRFGMRRPWMLGGIAGAALGLFVISLAGSIAGIAVGWTITQVSMQAVFVAIAAVIPDHVPMRQRGRVAGLFSVGTAAAPVVGTGLVALNPTSELWGFMSPPIIAVIAVVIFCAMLPDRRLGPGSNEPLSIKAILGSYWVNPREHSGFVWIWISRVLFFMAIVIMTVYKAYFLLARLGVEPERVAQLIFLLLLLNNGLSITTNMVAGWWSDRVGKRKVFIGYAAAIGTVGFLVAGTSTTMTQFVVGTIVLGLASGVYTSVDIAFATDMLPGGKGEAAKHMGIIAMAGLLPNFLAPLIAPAFLAIGASTALPGAPSGNYLVLYLAGAAFMAAGALAVIPIRGGR